MCLHGYIFFLCLLNCSGSLLINISDYISYLLLKVIKMVRNVKYVALILNLNILFTIFRED